MVKAHSARWLDESTAREKRGSGPCCSDVVGGGSAEEGIPAAVRPVKAIAAVNSECYYSSELFLFD